MSLFSKNDLEIMHHVYNTLKDDFEYLVQENENSQEKLTEQEQKLEDYKVYNPLSLFYIFLRCKLKIMPGV